MGLEARPLWQHLLWSTLEYVSQLQMEALCVWLTEIERWPPWVLEVCEGPRWVWRLGFCGNTSCGPPWSTSLNYK